MDEYIVFATSAEIKNGFRAWLCGNGPLQEGLDVGDGTYAKPLLRAVARATEGRKLTSVILVTDGNFDCPMDDVLERTRSIVASDVRWYPER
jgi:hypothetical protein